MNIENFEHLMSDKVIVWNDPESGQALRCCPLKEALVGDQANPTKVKVDVEAEAKRVVPAGVKYYIIERSAQPEKIFRSAWFIKEDVNSVGGAKIVALQDKAKEESLARVRKERDEKMIKLDGEELMMARKGTDEDLKKVYDKKEALCACTDPIKSFAKGGNECSVEALKEHLLPLEVIKEV